MSKAIIMVGIQGSGKSTVAKQRMSAVILEDGRVVYASADDYMIEEDGVYRFAIPKLGPAHRYCTKKFNQGLIDGAELVICDNTNCTVEEIAPYIAMARAWDYEVEIIRVHCDPEIAAERNTHGVPRKGVLAKHRQFERRMLPGHIEFDPMVTVTEVKNDA